MFNFFFNQKVKLEAQNSLDKGRDTRKDIIDNFIAFAKDTTEKRARDFDVLMSFALESSQWNNTDLKNMDNENDVALVFNSSQEYIERYMARLFPRNPHTGVMEVGVKAREDNADLSRKYESEILDIYYNYDLPDILLEQGVNFLCGGAACFYYPQNKITKRAELISLDPKKCFLGWSGGRLVQFAFKDYQGSGKYKTTYYDLKNIIVHDGLSDTYKHEENEFGIIPFFWIPNFPKPHTHEGISKVRVLSGLDKEYNERSSDFSKRIKENTEPHILIKTALSNIAKVSRGRKKQTRLGPDDDMKYLELKEGKEILDWLDKIEARINTKTGIVHSSGQAKIGVSGKSLSFQYSDMMDLIGFMRMAWDKGFRQMNNAILSYKFKTDIYYTDPVYQPFLMQDNSDRINDYAVMIDKNLISHKDAIDELRGVENAEEKLSEILEEMKKFKPETPEKNNFNK